MEMQGRFVELLARVKSVLPPEVQLVFEPGRLFSYGAGFLCTQVQQRNTHLLGRAKVPLHMYTVDASQFLHSIWDGGFVLRDMQLTEHESATESSNDINMISSV